MLSSWALQVAEDEQQAAWSPREQGSLPTQVAGCQHLKPAPALQSDGGKGNEDRTLSSSLGACGWKVVVVEDAARYCFMDQGGSGY